jgi:osmotically inducible lipoprotein OsmB
MRRILLAAAPAILLAIAPTTSRADNVGIAFGVGTGLLVAGPVGAVIGGVVGGVWGSPYWGPPIGPCWIDNSFRRQCGHYGRRWHHY